VIDALRYEYMRLRTLRSTYWLIGIAMAFQLVMSIVIAIVVANSDSAVDDDTVFDVLATIGASSGFAPLFIAFVIGLLGVFSTGHEYRHGMIRATLTAIPNRRHVFVAKVVSTILVSAFAAVLCILIALLCVLGFGLQAPSLKDFVDMTAGTTIFTVLFSLSGLAYGALTRNQTAAVALLLLVPTVIEAIIRAIVIAIKGFSDDPSEQGGFVQILRFLPYDAGGQLYTRASINDLLSFLGYTPFGAIGGGIVLTVFVSALLAGAYALFLRRDA
jgi:ABC-2 type transport system permease protein